MLKYLVFMIIFQSVSFSMSEILTSQIPYEELSPANQHTSKLRDFHIKGLDQIHSVWLFKNSTSFMAVSYLSNDLGTISNKTLAEIEPSTIKESLLRYYQTRLNISFEEQSDKKITMILPGENYLIMMILTISIVLTF